MKDIFNISLPKNIRHVEKLVKRFDYGDLVTFAENKTTPIYNWFYYKEGFSRSCVKNLLTELNIPKGSTILDPFCGTGTTLLASRELNYRSIGFDILPLGVFVTKTKLQTDYDTEMLDRTIKEITSLKFGPTDSKWVDVKFLDMKRAFSRYARNDILFFRDKILEISDEKIRNFLLLGLISIVTQASNTKKDGGVIKIVQKKHLAPVRYLLKNKLKRMYKDINRINFSNANAEVHLGDARSLDLEDESIDTVITSPPYLNFVDYTKLYGLELSLFLKNSDEILKIRKSSIRSHISAEYKESGIPESDELKRIFELIGTIDDKTPLVVKGYFEDMYLAMKEMYRVLKNNGLAILVVGNACLPMITVDIDLILAEIGEHIGFKLKEIWVANVRWCDVHGIVKERPVRESIVILEKE